MTNREIIACVVRMARILMAGEDYEYVYDPDHKHRPKGSGWKKTGDGWSKGKKDGDGDDKKGPESKDGEKKKSPGSKKVDKAIEDTLSKMSYENKSKISEDEKAPAKILGFLAKDSEWTIRYNVAQNPNTPKQALEALSKGSKSDKLGVSLNPNATPEILDGMVDDYGETVKISIIKHKNISVDSLKKLAKDPITSVSKMAINRLKNKGIEYDGEAKAETGKPDKLPKFKFKGDDKTQAIIRSKFEKGQDEEETNVIYGEMAKYSKEDLAPMGSYRGRNKEQVKSDFIKKMNPANYSSPEAFKHAKERIQKMSAQDFSRVLASIFSDDEEEEEDVK